MSDITPSLPLAQGGRPLVSISLPAQPSVAEEYAAEELRRHLYTIIGAGPRLRSAASRGRDAAGRIVINDRDAAIAAGIQIPDLATEGYHLETHDGNLYLLGGSARGVLYGVYDVLERLGCRWYTPEITRLPRRSAITLPPLRVTAAPAFEFRDMWNWDAHDPAWWVRNRLNGWYTPVPDYMGGHMTYEMFVHSFNVLVPPDEFFTAHPEYFSEVNGVRQREGGQLCLSNPDVLRIVTTRVLEHARANPRARILSVSQNDCAGYCTCPKCRAIDEEEGAQSGSLLRFVNAVAAETSKIYPDKLIDTLAYCYSLDAPRYVTPHPNVRVRLCSICCCQGHAYGTCDHSESLRFLRALQAWSRVTPQMYIWHYCTDFAHYPLPMPNYDELHANINLYKQFGVYGLFMQGMGEEGGGGETMALRAYVQSKLMWRPDQPVWPLVDEFLAAYYGAAAPQVRLYLDTFHQRVREQRDVHPSLYDPPTAPQFSPASTMPADAVLAEGEQRVRGEERRRVRLLRNGLTYARLFHEDLPYRIDGDWFRNDRPAEDSTAFEALLREWRQAGMLRIREGAPFDETAQLLRNRLASHQIAWLRGAEETFGVLPSLGGRLLTWEAHGRQWLSPPYPDAGHQYPANAGYAEFAITGLYAYAAWAEAYRSRESADGLRLTTRLSNGLDMARTYRCVANGLRIDSRLRNRNAVTQPYTWGASLHLRVPASTVIRMTTAAGIAEYPWETLPDGLVQARTLQADQLPRDGKLIIDMPGFRVQYQIAAMLDRLILGKIGDTGTLAIDVRSQAVTLASGDAMRARQTVHIVPVD